MYRFLNKKMDWSVINKLPKGKYVVRINMMVETDGKITFVKARSEKKTLNDEIEKVMMMYQNRIKIVDQNGNIRRNNAKFPITITVP